MNKLKGKAIADDFDWDLYHIHYRGEHVESAKDYAPILQAGDYSFEKGRLVKSREGTLPLHPNYRLLYETIIQLRASSVFELGCGSGDLLHNISVLVPGISLYGVDRSHEQLRFLRERHPSHSAVISQYDCSLPLPPSFPSVDVAYTQAVLMHIQTGNAHLVALSNLFCIAGDQVVLMENWRRHDFVEDIKKLQLLGLVPWKELYFYYRESEEFRRPHLMIASAVPLTQYPVLTDYSILREAVPA